MHNDKQTERIHYKYHGMVSNKFQGVANKHLLYPKRLSQNALKLHI